MKNIFTKTKVKENAKVQQEKFQNYCKKLKEIFCEGESKYDENYAEDGTQILRHRNFKVLSNISYDKEKKKFQFGKISEELKEMFLSYGIKKIGNSKIRKKFNEELMNIKKKDQNEIKDDYNKINNIIKNKKISNCNSKNKINSNNKSIKSSNIPSFSYHSYNSTTSSGCKINNK